MDRRYYYKNEAGQFAFIRIPKAMMTEEIFSPLSIQAKILYGLLLDRMSEAKKNKWIDDDNRVYVLYQISEIMEDMNLSRQKAVKALSELVEIGLVEKKQRGLGMPSLLYIKSFATDSAEVPKWNF